MTQILNNYGSKTLCVLWIGFILYLLVRYILIAAKKPRLEKVLVCLFFIDLITFMPLEIKSNGGFSIASSAIYVLRVFAMEMDFGEFISAVQGYSCFFPYHILSALLYALSPILAGAFILTFIKDKYKSIQLCLCMKKDIYIFSELNEKSLTLAKTIDNKKGKIIFLGTEEANPAMSEECSDNGFTVIDYSVERAYNRFKNHMWNRINGGTKRKKTTLFFIDSNEDVALDKMVSFLDGKLNSDAEIETALFLFSVHNEAEVIIDNYKDIIKNKNFEKITLRLINVSQLLSYQILEEHPFYLVDKDMLTDGVNATVVGLLKDGSNILKDLIWCGTLKDVNLRVNGVDKGDKDSLRKKFEYSYPEITKENYDIRFYGADPVGLDFDELIENEFSKSNYFVVALGDDETTLKVAWNIRMKYYRKHKKTPMIIAVIKEDNKFKASEIPYKRLGIRLAGRNSSLYSMNAILSNTVYRKAYLTDCAYNLKKKNKISDFDKFLNLKESLLRSNIASALHISYKLFNLTGIIPSWENAEAIKKILDDLSPEKRQEYDEFEHQRWMAFQRSEGWATPFNPEDYADENTLYNAMVKYREDNKSNPDAGGAYHKNLFARLHGCIIDYKYLDMLSEVMGKPRDEFKEFDRIINNEMFNIWSQFEEKTEKSI